MREQRSFSFDLKQSDSSNCVSIALSLCINHHILKIMTNFILKLDLSFLVLVL